MNDVMRALITMSAVATVLALILFALKPVVKNRLSKSFQYYSWLVVAVLLVVPIQISLPTAADNNAQTGEVTGRSFVTIRNTVDLYVITTNELIERAYSEGVEPSQDVVQYAKLNSPFSMWLTALALLWPLGIVVFLLINIIGYSRFCISLKKRNVPASAGDIRLLFSLCRKRPPVLFRNTVAATPMLIGVFRPMIVLPNQEYQEAQLRNILTHELTHLKRGDLLIKWFMMLINTAHWFNPLIYFVRREMSRACELSCDESVIKKLDKVGKQSYGDTLISVVAENPGSFGALSTTMCEEKKTLKERLVSIMKYKSKSKRIIALSVFLLIMLSVCALALSACYPSDSLEPPQSNEVVNGQLLNDLGYSQDVLIIIQNNETPYAGNNSMVGAIIEQLPIPWKGLAYAGFSLQTNEEPYGLTINYIESADQELSDYFENPFAASIRENNALLLFSAIDNLSIVNYHNPENMTQYSFVRDQFVAKFGQIPSIKSLGKIQELLGGNLLLEEFFFSHASRIYLGSSPNEAVYRNGDPQNIIELGTGFTLYEYPDTVYYYKDDMLHAKRETVSENMSYKDIVQKFGLPQSNETIKGKLYISYRLRNSGDDPFPEIENRQAFFVFESEKLMEAGLMVGDDYSILLISEDDLTAMASVTPPDEGDSGKYRGYATEYDFLHSPEGIQFRKATYGAAKALLRADSEELAGYLLDPNDASRITRSLTDIFDQVELMTFLFSFENDVISDDEIRPSYEYLLQGEDSYSYVSMTLKKADGEWKISSIGLEK